jgi:hypothetical protein
LGEQCTAFHYVDANRDRKRDHEQQTLETLDELTTCLEERSDL